MDRICPNIKTTSSRLDYFIIKSKNMKTLVESLFDKDLVERNIGFFNYYKWRFGQISLINREGSSAINLSANLDDNLFKKVFKTNKLNQLPKYKKLSMNNFDKYEQPILSQIYHTLEVVPFNEVDDRWKLGKVIYDSIEDIIKVPISGGMTTTHMYPLTKSTSINGDDVKKITTEAAYILSINKKSYDLIVYLSFEKK